ncbi:3-oxoacyl-[acyl-carrier-protein] synthase III C-terminal domain-containing protein [Paenibacillus beijingensis]|uniref:3-oxoacyl-ACP synthase n=1 Tax=Paenibacillus beijingensis TaxID=1126833 RepID=A0A0D5NJW8_9BACL|nr:3-oxoacyl-[acyl-carrier-protein] synthase III C-terminal domain-containing protein [Paenibacillus beijingensis]AJY75634.1 3-oxoacyl-ACP synthase [Paenibacillus beijingensis]
MNNVQIKSVAVYHPDNSVGNDYYLERLKAKGADITNLLAVLGRDKRYIIDNEQENSLTMAVNAAQSALNKAGLSGEDIDMIVYSSQTPEYLFPTNAIMVHNQIGGKASAICLDSNASCAGMVVAVEQASVYMSANPAVKRALIIGSDHVSPITDESEAVYFSAFGDAAAAVILERVEGAANAGLIDSAYYTCSEPINASLYPPKGLSNIYKQSIEKLKIVTNPFDTDMASKVAAEMIPDLLERNNVPLERVSAFCFSQFAVMYVNVLQEKLGLEKEKCIYIGDEFGYTGTSSPFIALHKAVESGQVKRGDDVIFWTVGTGWQNIVMLYRY